MSCAIHPGNESTSKKRNIDVTFYSHNKKSVFFSFLSSCGQWLCGICFKNRILHLSGEGAFLLFLKCISVGMTNV